MRHPILDDCLTRLHHETAELPSHRADAIHAIVSEMVSAWLHDRQTALFLTAELMRAGEALEAKDALIHLSCRRGLPLLEPYLIEEGQEDGWLPPMSQTRLPEEGIAAILRKGA